MARPTELPVYVCAACGKLWIGDENMYEETDRCPHCGRYAGEPVYGADEEFPWTGGGSSLQRLPLYFMTRGPMRFIEDPYGFILTTGTFNEADYRR